MAAAVVTAATGGNFALGMAVGGAVSGAILGAVHGGLEGALKGAAMGFVIGGTLGILGPGATAFAAVAGGVYAGATGGLEGLGDYAAGAIGAATGYFAATSAMSSLTGQATVKPPTGETQGGDSGLSKSPVVRENIDSGQITSLLDEAGGPLAYKSGITPLEGRMRAAYELALAAQKGQVGSANQSWFSRIKISGEAHAGIDIDAGATGVQLSFFGNTGAEQGFRATYSFPGGTIGAESGWNLITGEKFIRPVTSINYDIYPFVSVSHDPMSNSLSVSVSGGTGGESISVSYE